MVFVSCRCFVNGPVAINKLLLTKCGFLAGWPAPAGIPGLAAPAKIGSGQVQILRAVVDFW